MRHHEMSGISYREKPAATTISKKHVPACGNRIHASRLIEPPRRSRLQKNEGSQTQNPNLKSYFEAAGILERVKGIEPSYSAWKAAALPLSYTRAGQPCRKVALRARNWLVEEAGFEPAYAKRTDLQSVSFNHSDTPPSQQPRYDDWGFPCQHKQQTIVC